jgi:hypothetical protein
VALSIRQTLSDTEIHVDLHLGVDIDVVCVDVYAELIA